MIKPRTILKNRNNGNALLIMESSDQINDLMLKAIDKEDFIYLHILGLGKHKFMLDDLDNNYSFTNYIDPDYYDNFLELQWVEPNTGEYSGSSGMTQLRDYLEKHPNCRVVHWQVETSKNKYDETVETVFAQVRSNDPFEFM